MPHVTIQQAFDLALRHHHAGRLKDAENLYRQILQYDPRHLDAMHLLGTVAHQTGQSDLAVDLIRKAIANGLNTTHAYTNLGNALRNTGQPDGAIAAYRRAIALDPNSVEAHNNLGSALIDKGDTAGALTALRRAIELRPDVAEPHTHLGNALAQKGLLEEATAAHRRAIRIRPDYAEAHCNLGVTLKERGQLNEAVAAYRQAIALSPRDVVAISNLGGVLKDLGQLDEAVAMFRQAIAIAPANTDVASNLLLLLQYHPGFDAQAIAEESRRWNLQHAGQVQQFVHASAGKTAADRRLRIGYVSPDFRNHVVGRNILPLFREHDHQQFEIICYSQTRKPDAMTAQFQQHADAWKSIVGLSDQRVAGQIHDDRIDILVDLALHTADNRLGVFARKPAPVQVTFAGYPGSTGLTAIDYRLSDPWLDPAGVDESVYSEQTIRLPDSFWCFDPLDCRDIRGNSLPALQAEGLVTFGCLNNFCKINDDVLKLWAKVLQQVDHSRLLLRAGDGSHRSRTIDLLGREGIDRKRIVFAMPQPRREYLATYRRIDIGLDTFPYNGHTTSLESFWMGVPVVTLVGNRSVARAGWCQLSNLGLGELAGQTEEQFVQIAVELARDLPGLGQIRSTLRQRMEQSPLMDAKKFARNIEAAYRQMWRRWCEGQALLPLRGSR